MIGDKDRAELSNYQPSAEVTELTKLFKRGYHDGYQNLHTSFEELNNYSVIARMNKDQLTFNSFVDESVEDPREAWKWKGTRGQARKNTMAMHAHLTSQYIVPSVYAQNEAQEIDREMSDVAHDILQWMTINSNYRSSFLLATMGMLVNPVTYLGAEYAEVYQKIKDRDEDGKLTTREVLDEVFSGFQAPVYSADQVLIPNAYEQNIQKQYIVAKRRFIDYSEAEAIYSEHDHWGYVHKGIVSFYNEEDGLFYDVKDDDHKNEVEEVTFYCRRDDTEVVYINGIYMGDKDTEANPMSHRDNRGAPKVPLTPFGYERINEHFFFYKSLVNNVGWDNTLLDAMYQITMNKEIMDLLPAMVVTGVDSIDTDMVLPGSMFVSSNPDFEMKPVMQRGTNVAGYNAMQSIEKSMNDASLSEVGRGQTGDSSTSATAVATANSNAQILLSGVGKTLGESVMQYGQLMLDIALNHLTVAHIDEITGKTKYKNFMLQNQTVAGKQVDKKIFFDESLIGRKMSKEEQDTQALMAYEHTKKSDGREYLYRINPRLWSMMKYLCRIEPDTMIPKNREFEKAQSQQMYTLLRQDPLVSPETLVRKLISTHYRGEENEFIVDESKVEEVLGGMVKPEGDTITPGKVPSRKQTEPALTAVA